MKNLNSQKAISIHLIILFCVANFASSLAQINKETDWDTAQSLAKQQNKDILIILTGSEWCRPCVKMKRNVIEQAKFIEYVHKKLVIFEINIPQHQDLSSKVMKDYRIFSERYQTNALPSLILVDTEGKEKTRIISGLASLETVLEKLQKFDN